MSESCFCFVAVAIGDMGAGRKRTAEELGMCSCCRADLSENLIHC